MALTEAQVIPYPKIADIQFSENLTFIDEPTSIQRGHRKTYRYTKKAPTLGGRLRMKQPTKKQRIALTVSAVWILGFFGFVCEVSNRSFDVGPFIIIGILPVLIGWAIWWISRATRQVDRAKDS